MASPSDLTWTCHVCGDERPDEKISVHKVEGMTAARGAEVEANVRYCNDRPGCAEGAQAVGEGWLGRGA